MDYRSYLSGAFVALFMFLSAHTCFAATTTITELQQRTQTLQKNIAEAEHALPKLQSTLAEIETDEPAVAKEYADVSAELEQSFEKAKNEDTEAVNDAMIVSFRFNRIDRKHERFQEKKQETVDAITNTQTDIDRWRAEIALNDEKIAELKEAENARQLALAAEKLAADKAAIKAQQLKKDVAAAAVAAPMVAAKSKTPDVASNTAAEKTRSAEQSSATSMATWPDIENASSAQITFAKQELARLTALPDQKSVLGRVRVRSSCGDENLDYVGGAIYSSVVELSGNVCKFTVFNDEFWFTLTNPQPAKYRFIYDTTSISSPKMFVFEERILQ